MSSGDATDRENLALVIEEVQHLAARLVDDERDEGTPDIAIARGLLQAASVVFQEDQVQRGNNPLSSLAWRAACRDAYELRLAQLRHEDEEPT